MNDFMDTDFIETQGEFLLNSQQLPSIAYHNLNRSFICIEKDYDYLRASCDVCQLQENY